MYSTAHTSKRSKEAAHGGTHLFCLLMLTAHNSISPAPPHEQRENKNEGQFVFVASDEINLFTASSPPTLASWSRQHRSSFRNVNSGCATGSFMLHIHAWNNIFSSFSRRVLPLCHTSVSLWPLYNIFGQFESHRNPSILFKRPQLRLVHEKLFSQPFSVDNLFWRCLCASRSYGLLNGMLGFR